LRKSNLLLIFVLSLPLSANTTSTGVEIAKKLHINPAYRAIVQWERVFSSARKMKRYKIDTLTPKQQKKLKIYLINHAIDSEQPTMAGDFS